MNANVSFGTEMPTKRHVIMYVHEHIQALHPYFYFASAPHPTLSKVLLQWNTINCHLHAHIISSTTLTPAPTITTTPFHSSFQQFFQF